MRWPGTLLALAAISAAASGAARADEIRLRDGSKIVGTIVGFEDGSFKVETAYGFAMVRKANIAEIVPETNPKDAKPDAKLAEAAAAKPAGRAAAAATPAPKSTAKPESTASAPASSAPAAPPATRVTVAADHAAAAPAAPAAPPPAAPEPAPPPNPVPVQEAVIGNVYTNQTYGFSMFRPPAWEVLKDRSAMPEAITALGTEDHSTLLVIGHDTMNNQLGNSQLDARASATERKLRDIYENYRPLTPRHFNIAGVPAAEQRFRGKADGHDWSVTAVTLIRGNDVFTILGMTYADSDLIQLQEAVMSKTIASLQFTPAQ